MLLPKSALKLFGLVVIVISLISYYFSTSITALISFGLFLIILHFLYDKNNKLIAHIAVLLILLLLAGLYKPMTGAIDRGDSFAILRVATMMLTTLYVFICFIKSFIVKNCYPYNGTNMFFDTLVFTFLFTSCNNNSKPVYATDSFKKGETIYKTLCISCHNMDPRKDGAYWHQISQVRITNLLKV